jgi:chromosome segregation ATPase
MNISEIVSIVAVIAVIITAFVALRRAPVEIRKSQSETRKLDEETKHTTAEIEAHLRDMVLAELARVEKERDIVRNELRESVEALRRSVLAAETSAAIYEDHIKVLTGIVADLTRQVSEQNKYIEKANTEYALNIAKLEREIVTLKSKFAELIADRDYWRGQVKQ